ncbi:aspartate dehydrogenase [Primorskyibacter sp. S187A]|uniref:aspartate dehydrogenase n=1 Tax=Primorskyibacter sp. S187A TaxID=3415130 RepID=UPI003C7C4D63
MQIGLIGFGAIGREVCARLQADPRFEITVLTRSPVSDTPSGVVAATSFDDLLVRAPDLIVECAGHEAVQNYGSATLSAGIPLLVASVGALADAGLEAALFASAQSAGVRLILPSGAIGGLDVLRALASEGELTLHYEGIKPPTAWKGSPAQDLINLDALETATTFFDSTGRDTALRFPKNANVVAALALAGGGFDRMRACLIADPAASANTHRYRVMSEACTYEMQIQNAPSPGNPRTSLTTVLSIVENIRAFAAQSTCDQTKA